MGLYFLDETLNAIQIAGLLLTVGSLLGIVWFSSPPTRGRAHAGALCLAVLACVAQAIGIVAARRAMPEVGVILGTLLRLAPAVVALTLVAFLPLKTRSPAIAWRQVNVPMLTLAAFLGGVVGLLLFTAAIKFTKAGIAAALSMSYPLWVLPIARFWLKEKITWQSAVFTLMAVLGILILFLG